MANALNQKPFSGAWTYQSLVDAGLISADGSQGGSGFKRCKSPRWLCERKFALTNNEKDWDECTSTPFLFNPEQKQLISYSDAESNAAKVKWLQANGVAGWSLWETSDFSQCSSGSLGTR